MGLESKTVPPLPAPTESESIVTPTDLTTDDSKPSDDKSSYSLPDDGTPITIKTRSHRANHSRTSLLIEYFEGGRDDSVSPALEGRRPSVHIRVTPSKKSKGDRLLITEAKSSRKVSGSRRAPASPITPHHPALTDPLELGADDAKSMNSYASATEESNVSRNPIDIGIDLERPSRRRRPASPLIPPSDSKVSSYVPLVDMSEVSAMPSDSFLDGSGPVRTSDASRARSPPPRDREAIKSSKIRPATRDRVKIALAEKPRESRDKDRKHRPSKSRGSSVGEKENASVSSTRRRSSRTHAPQDSVISGADSSVVSGSQRSIDQSSVRSGNSSKVSINNPKLLDAVEDAIRRLILPEIATLRRESSRREGRRSSNSSVRSLSREELSSERRRSSGGHAREGSRHKEKHDHLESHRRYADSPHSFDRESVEDAASVRDTGSRTPHRSGDHLKAAAGGAVAAAISGGLLAAASKDRTHSPAVDEGRRRTRAERLRASTASRDSDDSEDLDDADDHHVPTMPVPLPLMSEVNPSEVTRTSILSAETDRPHSAAEERSPGQGIAHRGGSGSGASTPTPTKTPVTLQHSLQTLHANISHGDLRALPRGGKPDEDLNPGLLDQGDEYNQGPVLSNPAIERHEYEDDEYDDGAYMDPSYDYYNTQDVPPPLKYVPYQPERRGLSPIYSVSGYTEGGGSEAAQGNQRDSRATHTSYSESLDKSPRPDGLVPSPRSALSNTRSREFDHHSERSLRSPSADPYRNTMYGEEGSDLDDSSSRQAVRGVGASPNLVHVPFGVESNVASLVDGSALDQSVLTGSGYEPGARDSMDSYDDYPRTHSRGPNLSPTKHSVDEQHGLEQERDGTPSSRRSHRSREFAEEYDIDEYGNKVPRTQYRQSATGSDKVIASAVGAAAAALKAAKGRQAPREIETGEFVPAGVARNRSFKERTLAGHKPANTPTHSVDRLVLDDVPKFGASGIPDLDDPMPEIGYVDESETHSNRSIVRERLDGYDEEDDVVAGWHGHATPTQRSVDSFQPPDKSASGGRGLGITEAAGATVLSTAAMGVADSRQTSQSQEQDDEWHRTSDDHKRDTLVTNPYEGTSPVVIPVLGDNMLTTTRDFNPSYDVVTPPAIPGPGNDEGYMSQGPNRTPDFQHKELNISNQPDFDQVEDPFYIPKGHNRHLSGLSHGMTTPFYDAATGGGIDRIENKDIIALMQELIARDAKRDARDTELAQTVMFVVQELRSGLQHVEDRIKRSENNVLDEVVESEKNVIKAIGGPRPYPGSSTARSLQGGSQPGVVDDYAVKKGNFIKRALKGLRTSGTNDLSRIEDMLLTLLQEVDVLKAQTAPPKSSGAQPSYDNLTSGGAPLDQDTGYEPDGRADASIASHPSQSGHLSGGPQSRGASSTRLGYERKFSDHRISTVHEDPEQEREHGVNDGEPLAARFMDQTLLSPVHNQAQRGGSVPLGTPPSAPADAHMSSQSSENTPKTDKSRKHKSSGSSGFIPKVSRWSETTASSVGRIFRSSGRKDRDSDLSPQSPRVQSRSGSELGQYNDYQATDPYGDDKLHSGFSGTNLPSGSQPVDLEPPPPGMFMTPEDPKYKVHRDSLNLQHPQPRAGQTERFKANLESQAHQFETPATPRSADWAGSNPSLHRYQAEATHYDDERFWASSPGAGASGAPPRPPKEPLETTPRYSTPARGSRLSKVQKTSPLPHQSMESGYYTGTATHTNYTGSPKLENRNLSSALGAPTRRPSGPRAMTPKSADEEAAREDRRRKRDTFGSIVSDNANY